MSEVKKDVPAQPSLLDQLRMQHASFMQQKDLAQNNLNQLVGAVYACEVMIKKHEEMEAQKGLSMENLGDQGNGEADQQKKEQSTQE
jgi:hypothetical protein